MASKFMAGALLGVVAGLLMAPERGEVTRNNLADTAERWKRKIDKMTGKTGTQLDDLRSLLEDEVDGISDDVRQRILTILDEAEDMAYSPNGHLSNGVS